MIALIGGCRSRRFGSRWIHVLASGLDRRWSLAVVAQDALPRLRWAFFPDDCFLAVRNPRSRKGRPVFRLRVSSLLTKPYTSTSARSPRPALIRDANLFALEPLAKSSEFRFQATSSCSYQYPRKGNQNEIIRKSAQVLHDNRPQGGDVPRPRFDPGVYVHLTGVRRKKQWP